jgi:hypothetical protein
MRKLNSRESIVIVTALKNQCREFCKEIKVLEKEGKHLIFTENFIKKEHDDLIKLVQDNTKKPRKK